MSEFSDNLHMSVLRTAIPIFDDLPGEAQDAIEAASDAVVDAVGRVVRWLFD